MVLEVRKGTVVPNDLAKALEEVGIGIKSFNPDPSSEVPKRFQPKPPEIEIPVEFN